MRRNDVKSTTWLGLAAAGLFTATMIVPAVRTSVGYETYDGCVTCHGDFDGPQSPQGTTFPGDSKHTMHRGSQNMNTDCSLCHGGAGFTPVMIGSSAGTPDNPGVGCTGCHGHDYGGGGTAGNNGVGLRDHHRNSGISCSPCHDGDPASMPENATPVYYGTPDTNCDDPCNAGPDFFENWSIGDTRGLDNDGDLLYDGDDPDCSGGDPCPQDIDGDGVIGFSDLLDILSFWGPCADPPNCPQDIDGDGIVGFSDLLEVLSFWGPCP